MYQPSTRFSISMPHEVSKSAGHWKRKLRTRNGASITDEETTLMRRKEFDLDSMKRRDKPVAAQE
jgi:hypothetical protein